MIPFVNLTAQRDAYRHELEKAEKDVLDSGCYVGGPEVHALELELGNFCQKNGISSNVAPSVITCGSGTEALTIALMALGIAPGDEVIVPDFTFIAPAECVAALGGVPVFADIDEHTLQMDPNSVGQRMSQKTKGIIAVNLFGQCAPYSALRQIANENHLWLLEDSAQAFGARQAGQADTDHGDAVRAQAACTFGDISITSFYPSKPLGCYGDGGALFTGNPEVAAKIRQIANHGSRERYQHEIEGVNSRLDSLQAAVLRVKLRHLEKELALRSQNAEKYNEFFTHDGIAFGATPQAIAKGNTSTYAQYTLKLDDRARFTRLLEQIDVPYCIHYPRALHRQPCFAGIAQNVSNPVTDDICEKVVSLPVCAFTDVNPILQKMREAL